jgi:predicted amidophosphoribosyltransferase
VAADLLEKSIRNSVLNPEKYIFTNVPRRRKAILEYGIDHSALLARELAKRFGARYVKILRSNAKAPQKSLETNERLKNADFAIENEADLSKESVIVVDDIITSGASMASAAMHIRSLGCKNITAATLAIAYKDS